MKTTSNIKNVRVIFKNETSKVMIFTDMIGLDRNTIKDISFSSGIKDVNNVEIYENEYVEATIPLEFNVLSKKSEKVFGCVVFDEGAFCLDIIDYVTPNAKDVYDIGQKIELYKFDNLEIKSI